MTKLTFPLSEFDRSLVRTAVIYLRSARDVSEVWGVVLASDPERPHNEIKALVEIARAELEQEVR